jgi:hypothetical protein
MLKEGGTEFFLTRHTKRGKGSERYPGISEEGVELARERVPDIIKEIENSSPGTVVVLLGVSPLERTRSTMKVYWEGIREGLKGREDVVIISQKEIKDLYREEKGVHKTIEAIKKRIAENPKAKVVIEFPLAIGGLDIAKEWYHPEDINKPPEERRFSSYVDHLGGIERFRKERDKVLKQWFDEKGIVNGEQLGPNPQKIAEEYFEALRRMEGFVRKIFPQEPLRIIFVGHSVEGDAFLTFLANQGKVSSEGFEKIGGTEIKETEPAKIIIEKDGTIKLIYRDKEFKYTPKKS